MKVHWLKNKDTNTHFFHQRASSRRRRNFIAWLHDQSGRWINDGNALRDHI